RDIHIPARDLDQFAISKTSLMPANVVAQLTFTQFIDLVAFLKDRKAQESLRGLVPEFWVVGPFGGDLQTAYPPEGKPDPSATYEATKGSKISWQPVAAESSGYLN